MNVCCAWKWGVPGGDPIAATDERVQLLLTQACSEQGLNRADTTAAICGGQQAPVSSQRAGLGTSETKVRSGSLSPQNTASLAAVPAEKPGVEADRQEAAQFKTQLARVVSSDFADAFNSKVAEASQWASVYKLFAGTVASFTVSPAFVPPFLHAIRTHDWYVTTGTSRLLCHDWYVKIGTS